MAIVTGMTAAKILELFTGKASTTHASTHAAAGSDPVTLTAAQVTDLTETVQDAVATLVDTPTSATRAALDEHYAPARVMTDWVNVAHYDTQRRVTTAGIQAALDAVSESSDRNGAGGAVVIPGVGHVLTDSIQLRPRVTLRGGGRIRRVVNPGTGVGLADDDYVLIGAPGKPIFKTGTYPTGMDSLTNTDIALREFSARATGAPVLEAYAMLNFVIDGVDFASSGLTSADMGTITARYSYRGVIGSSRILGGGGGECLHLFDNVNGVTIGENIMSGGALGGAVKVGRSVNVTVRGNIIESSRRGIVFGGTGAEADGNGACNAPVIIGNYLERTLVPIELGKIYSVLGGLVHGNSISFEGQTTTASAYGGTAPAAGIDVARIDGIRFAGNRFMLNNESPAYRIGYVASSEGSIPNPVRCHFDGDSIKQPKDGVIYDLSGFPNLGIRARFAGLNRVQTDLSHAGVTGVREYVTPLIAANVGVPLMAIAPAHQWGGYVLSLEVLDATGDLTSSIRLGVPANEVEIADVSPAALNYTNRAALHTIGTTWRADSPLTLRVIPGTGTGTYRLRIRWHSA